MVAKQASSNSFATRYVSRCCADAAGTPPQMSAQPSARLADLSHLFGMPPAGGPLAGATQLPLMEPLLQQVASSLAAGAPGGGGGGGGGAGMSPRSGLQTPHFYHAGGYLLHNPSLGLRGSHHHHHHGHQYPLVHPQGARVLAHHGGGAGSGGYAYYSQQPSLRHQPAASLLRQPSNASSLGTAAVWRGVGGSSSQRAPPAAAGLPHAHSW